jgi:hypothetical protein
MKKKKSKRELIQELHDSWIFRDGKLAYNEEYPWVVDLITYVHIEIDEPINDHVLRVIHGFSIYMQNYANAVDAVEFERFLKHGALVSVTAQGRVSNRYYKEWLALPNTNREFFCDNYIRIAIDNYAMPEEEIEKIVNILAGGYTEWAKNVLSYVSQYLMRNGE